MFGAAVIYISDNPRLFSPLLRHAFSCRTGPLRLNALAVSAVSLTHLLDRFSCIAVAFTVSGDIDNTQVNPEDALRLKRRRFLYCDSDAEVEHSVSQQE